MAAIQRPGTMPDLVNVLTPSDFYLPVHAGIWGAALEAYGQGCEVNSVTVSERLAANSGGRWGTGELAKLFPFDWYGWRDAAGSVVKLARRRAALAVASELATMARDESVDPAEAVDRALGALGGIDIPNADRVPEGLVDVDTLVDRPPTAAAEWLIPGLLRRGWRAILVGGEGTGKSVIGRQLAILAAQGIHPFTERPIPLVRSLIVDLENPEDVVADTARPMRNQLRMEVGAAYEPGRAWVWLRPGGVDLRSRAGRRQLEAVLAWCRPDLVCLGPLYKAFRKTKGETDEDAAAEVQQVLDDLRTRYRFAMVIEHHAPKAQHGFRDWIPFGSSLWLRWPELGLGLKPDKNDPHHHTIVRWRGDRAKTCWPEELRWGQKWPWNATYADASWRAADF